jgi:two-component system, NarL family, response regulator NreC
MSKVLIVDDHATLRRGLRGLLEPHPGWGCCAEADSGEEAIRAASEFKPDVIIMDVSMPGMGGIKATKIIHETLPAIRILLLTLHKSTELLRAAFSVGATGYVLKSDAEEDLVKALEAVSRGEVYVTRTISPAVVADILRETKQLQGVATGTTGPTARIAKAQL